MMISWFGTSLIITNKLTLLYGIKWLPIRPLSEVAICYYLIILNPSLLKLFLNKIE